MTDEERIDQMRVLWKKARNMYSSFFTLLDDKRKEIGDDKLPDWCFWQLHIGLEACMEVSNCLREADAKRVKDELIPAKQAARAKRMAEADAERQRLEAIRALRAANKAEQDAETKRLQDLAALQLSRGTTQITEEMVAMCKLRLIQKKPLLEKELMEMFNCRSNTPIKGAIERARGQLQAEAGIHGFEYGKYTPPKKPRKTSPGGGKKKKTDSRDTVNKLQPPNTTTSIANTDTADIGTMTDTELGMSINTALSRRKSAEDRMGTARQEWIEATLRLAALLAEARRRFPSDPNFGKWRKENNLGNDIIRANDIAALIGMGKDLTITRTALENSDSWSWQLIWKNISGFSPNVSKEEISPTTVH